MLIKIKNKKKSPPPLTLMPSINAVACGARHDLCFQKVTAPQDSSFVLIFSLALMPIFSLFYLSLIVWQTSQQEERQISLFPVDIVLSELAVTALNNLAPILFLDAPFFFFLSETLPPSPYSLLSGPSPPSFYLFLFSLHFLPFIPHSTL